MVDLHIQTVSILPPVKPLFLLQILFVHHNTFFQVCSPLLSKGASSMWCRIWFLRCFLISCPLPALPKLPTWPVCLEKVTSSPHAIPLWSGLALLYIPGHVIAFSAMTLVLLSRWLPFFVDSEKDGKTVFNLVEGTADLPSVDNGGSRCSVQCSSLVTFRENALTSFCSTDF